MLVVYTCDTSTPPTPSVYSGCKGPLHSLSPDRVLADELNLSVSPPAFDYTVDQKRDGTKPTQTDQEF